MSVLNFPEPKEVFNFFEEISRIPRGSYNMSAIADYCVDFANKRSLKVIRDKADNIIIFKNATEGYENAEPVILQGHLDIVCQKTPDREIDFETEGLDIYCDGDYLKARGTTLGADNGIAVAMVLAILASDSIPHPEIQAVFTTDEEVGMVGAMRLDTSVLSAKRMINLDSEDIDCVTVSCAGGSDFTAKMPIERVETCGTQVTIALKGLKGGHSGVCINEGRINANILAGRILHILSGESDFSLLSVSGGDKCNAIPNACEIKVITTDKDFVDKAKKITEIIKNENAVREENFTAEITVKGNVTAKTFIKKDAQKLIYALLFAPDSVITMSAEIDGLVETSLNLGILNTEENVQTFVFALRSNKKSALKYLEQKLCAFFENLNCEVSAGGHYPPWEFNPDSKLQRLYIDAYTEYFGEPPRVEAIHAGLECGVFADKIEGIDAIAIGPQMYDVHTTSERLVMSSVGQVYKILLKILQRSN